MRPFLKPFAHSITAGLLLLTLGVSLTPAKDPEPAAKGRWLKIRVYENNSSTPNVLVNLPLRAASTLVQIAARSGLLDAAVEVDVNLPSEGEDKGSLRVSGKDVEQFWEAIASMEPGQLVQIQDDGDRVEIWIE
jgi:hypothetical protein